MAWWLGCCPCNPRVMGFTSGCGVIHNLHHGLVYRGMVLHYAAQFCGNAHVVFVIQAVHCVMKSISFELVFRTVVECVLGFQSLFSLGV